MRRQFALIGKSGAGKSTAACILTAVYGVRRVSTGDICRKISYMLMGNDDKSSTQLIDDALISIDPSIILKAALRDVEESEAICLDSLRFKSDMQIARDRGFYIIRITAADDTRVRRLASRGQTFDMNTDGRHRSETELDDAEVDLIIQNDGDRRSMHAAIEQINAEAL